MFAQKVEKSLRALVLVLKIADVFYARPQILQIFLQYTGDFGVFA